MRTGTRPWSEDESVKLAELWAAGTPQEEIAAALGRSPAAIQVRIPRFVGCPIDGHLPRWGRSPYGADGPYWTRERTLDGLRDFVARNKGRLPSSSDAYNVVKRGHMEWPPSGRVLAYFDSMADAWAAAGASPRRYRRLWIDWTQEEEDLLVDLAGSMTLDLIAKRIGRSAGACKRKLYDLGAGRARDMSGHYSAMQVAELYGCPLARVNSLIRHGLLKARKVTGGHYWRIDPGDIDARAENILRAPKRTHTTVPPDTGNYERRYGLRRETIDGRQIRVPAGRASR